MIEVAELPIQRAPDEQEALKATIARLQETFETFALRSQKLEGAYGSLQNQVQNLNVELDRKNAALAESLKQQEEMRTYLSSILESMHSGVIGVDRLGTITQFNRAAEEITGFNREQVLDEKYEDLFAKPGTPSLLETLFSGNELSRDEKILWHKDGHPVPVSYQTAKLSDTLKRSIGAVEIFSDLTRIKALEEEMQRTKTMAALGEMAATVAHEIRNPLGAMGGWAGLLERDLDTNDPRRKTLGKIIEGLSRLNRIVSNLLVYTRPVKATMRTVNLVALIDEIVEFIGLEIERQHQGVTIVKEYDPVSNVAALVDPEKMHQVLMNLSLNAIQAMPDGGVLTFTIEGTPRDKHGFIGFEIRDTGKGIAEENLAKIFDPFFTTKENGTGLGLAIVKKIVEFHGGIIAIQSPGSAGTTAKVFLPSAP